MNRMFLILLLVATTGALMLGSGCKQPTEVDEPGCEDNSAPVIGKLFFEVNGEATDAPAELFDGDTLAVSYQYVDYECNLEGGSIYFKIDSVNWEDSLVKNLAFATPCSSEEAGEPVGFEIVISNLAPGEHSYKTVWLDDCDFRSNEKEGVFVVLDPEDEI
jgi:hypothetical protein